MGSTGTQKPPASQGSVTTSESGPVLPRGSASLWESFLEATSQGQWQPEEDLKWKHVQEFLPMWFMETYPG